MSSEDIFLEVQLRPLNQYHRLQQFPVKIGRALDNDIILSDTSISNQHLVINQTVHGLEIINVSTENGTRLNGKKIEKALVDLREPVKLKLGNRQLRLLTAEMQGAKTALYECYGFLRLFCHWGFSLFLISLMIGAFLYDAYLQSIFNKEPIYYVSMFMPYFLGMIALALLIAGISRLANQRWEIIPALSLATLFMLIPHGLGELGHALNYFFTANWPLNNLLLISNFILMPLLLYFYIRLVHQSERWPALGIALLFSAPLLVYQAMELTDQWTIDSEYNGQANFNRSLSAWDLRLKPTLNIDEFFIETQNALAKPMP